MKTLRMLAIFVCAALLLCSGGIASAGQGDVEIPVLEQDGEQYIPLDALLAALGLESAEKEPQPASSAYGYQGVFDENAALDQPVNVSSGEQVIENRQIFVKNGSAVQNSGSSTVLVRDSYIRGDADAPTAPLEGNPGNLLVAGTIRTTLALGQSQAFYINSTVVSRNWAALSTDGAVPAQREGERELSLYTYGSEAVTQDGGYGCYSDLFCNLYVYGSRVSAAEIGVISGTYGRVTAGSIADGENNAALASKLTQADRAAQTDKTLCSVIEGGRNALMLHSVNLPPYWAYEGYSQAELPLYATEVNAKNTTFITNMALDKNVVYDAQKQAYIDHTAGSVILIKSTNVDIVLESCRLVADANGTGNLIHSVYNNDAMFMNAVPEGAQYPGMRIRMTNMDVTGDICDEDYQRDMYVTLKNTAFTGAVNYYDCAHWNAAAADEGFADYAPDASYGFTNGVCLSLTEGTVWNVTNNSRVQSLDIDETSSVIGAVMTVNGVVTPIVPGEYQGEVVLTPNV